MNFFKSLLPKSLTSRILAMLSILILTFLTTGLGLFYKNQLLQHIEEIQDTAKETLKKVSRFGKIPQHLSPSLPDETDDLRR
uniref:hypothetical protein n=1 Tax=Pseudomonas syringae TaxID=317 RepID=UPI0005CB49B9